MAGKIIQRWTKQARTIIDIVYTSNVHLTAEEIYLRAREQLPNISLGTVYRNLDRFKAQGIIAEVLVGRLAPLQNIPIRTLTSSVKNVIGSFAFHMI